MPVCSPPLSHVLCLPGWLAVALLDADHRRNAFSAFGNPFGKVKRRHANRNSEKRKTFRLRPFDGFDGSADGRLVGAWQSSRAHRPSEYQHEYGTVFQVARHPDSSRTS